jgi:large subunit ribosomal protein L10
MTILEMSQFIKEFEERYGVTAAAPVAVAAAPGAGAPAAAAESAREFFVGPTGIAFGYDDPIATAKKALDFAEKNDKFKVKSGLVEGKVYTLADLKAISKLPARNVLLSMLAGALQAPLAKLAGAMNATVSQFAYALEGLKNKKIT